MVHLKCVPFILILVDSSFIPGSGTAVASSKISGGIKFPGEISRLRETGKDRIDIKSAINIVNLQWKHRPLVRDDCNDRLLRGVICFFPGRRRKHLDFFQCSSGCSRKSLEPLKEKDRSLVISYCFVQRRPANERSSFRATNLHIN